MGNETVKWKNHEYAYISVLSDTIFFMVETIFYVPVDELEHCCFFSILFALMTFSKIILFLLNTHFLKLKETPILDAGLREIL